MLSGVPGPVCPCLNAGKANSGFNLIVKVSQSSAVGARLHTGDFSDLGYSDVPLETPPVPSQIIVS